MACQGLLGFIACPGSFPSCHEENDPNPKSGWDLEPDKLVCAVSCWDISLTQHFCVLFHGFHPNFRTFANDPRVIESVIGSVPVEQAHRKRF